MYFVDLLGSTETGVDKLVFFQFSIAQGVQLFVAIAEVGDSGMLNLFNPCPNFQGDGIGVVAKETMTDEFRSR